MNRWSTIIVLALSFNAHAADDGPIPSALCPENVTKPGHSMLGESFNEGPRRAAVLLGNTGRVTFAVTTKSPIAQQFFNQGIGQLHGYWYFEAERSFRQVAKLDPDCAMAYWGMALANINNTQRAKGFLAGAVQRLANGSEREKLFINALNAWYQAEDDTSDKKKSRIKQYVSAIEEIVYRYPDELEAKAFLCRVLTQNFDELGSTGAFAVDALLNAVLAENQYHPVHHYRIHLWDNDKAKVAVLSAERCGLSAPGIAHMWHMSGHTYSDLNQYHDAVWHQEASARTDHAYMMRDGIFPDRIHNFAHNNEWLAKNLQYIGRIHDAIAVARNAIELPRHPHLNTLPGDKSAQDGRMRLFQVYSDFELWERLIADARTPILGPTNVDYEQIKRLRFLGRAYFRSNDIENGRAQLVQLEERLARLNRDEEQLKKEAAEKTQPDGTPAKPDESKRKKIEDAKKPVDHAIEELKGFVLLTEQKPEQALERFIKANSVDDAFLADVELRAGKADAAVKRLRDWAGRNKNQVRPLAALVELLWKQGQKDEARQTFETLRDISEDINREIPVFARLQPIANELGYPADWRKPRSVPRNAAELPDLATLGPLTWQPSPAPEWTLPDGAGGLHSLLDYRGKPVIVIFYLGTGCLHCAQQLKAFAEEKNAFAAEGITLVAISTDPLTVLKTSQDRYNDEGVFPFQLVSDSGLSVFKSYRAYDDFEETPLHATMLIDGAGKIRWHDVGAEPFMDPGFLLEESRRLLDLNRLDPSIKEASQAASGSFAIPAPGPSLEAAPAKSQQTALGCN